MKIVATSDWHADAFTLGVDRYPDIERNVLASVELAVEEEVDLYIFAGDLSDPDTPGTQRALGLAGQAASMLYRHGIVSIWVAGNHDVVEDGSGATTLRALAGIEQGGALAAGVRVFERPAARIIATRSGDVAMVALPYPSRATHYDPGAFVDSLEAFPSSLPLIVVGHLALEGMHPGSESKDMARGRSVTWPLAELGQVVPDGALILGGHYHVPIEVAISRLPGQASLPLHIVGAPDALVMGERFAPRMVLAEWEPARIAAKGRARKPAADVRNPGSGHWRASSKPFEGRDLVTIEATDRLWTPEGWAEKERLPRPGALVKAFPPAEGGMPPAELEARLKGAGVARVVLMPPAPSDRVVLEPSKRAQHPSQTIREVVASLVDAARLPAGVDRETVRDALDQHLVAVGL